MLFQFPCASTHRCINSNCFSPVSLKHNRFNAELCFVLRHSRVKPHVFQRVVSISINLPHSVHLGGCAGWGRVHPHGGVLDSGLLPSQGSLWSGGACPNCFGLCGETNGWVYCVFVFAFFSGLPMNRVSSKGKPNGKTHLRFIFYGGVT